MIKTYSSEQIKMIQYAARIEIAKRDFFYFCNTLASDFYLENRKYLKILCNTLQALYEGRIVKPVAQTKWIVLKNKEELKKYTNCQICKKIMINMPPQHGKSRTLVNFCCWVFGQNPTEKIITASYNDDVASDFSRYTRDEIAAGKINMFDICYSDIFPNTKIKQGNASFEKWALEGQHFSYLGAGIGGSVTSKGGTILIVDDPIKGAKEAFNENFLNEIWKWYTNTFRSRVSAKGGEPLEIINMTRWSEKDICGRLLKSKEKDEWYILKLEACDEKTGRMLCSDILNRKRYLDQKNLLDTSIFYANYHQKPRDLQGKLYTKLKTYTHYPRDEEGNLLFEKIVAYTDTADEGDDYLCTIIAGIYNKELYVLDVVYTKEGMEKTEEMVAQALYENKVNFALFESNNGGKGFARNVEKILQEKYNSNYTVIDWFHQSKNKNARILTNATWIMHHIYFPVNWYIRWSEYFEAMDTYQKEGKNEHDDAQDATTGIAEMIQSDYEDPIEVLK